MSATDASTATTIDTVEPENSSNTIMEKEEEEGDNFVDAHDTFPEDDNRNYEAEVMKNDAEVDDEEEDQFEDTVEDMYEEDYRPLLPNMCSVEDKIDTDLSDVNDDDGTSFTASYDIDGAIPDCSLTIPDSSSVAAVSDCASIKKNNKKQKKNQKPFDGSFVTPDVTSATTNESSFLSGPLSIPNGSLTTTGDDDPSHMPRVLPDGRELLFSWSSSTSTAGGAVSGSIAGSGSMDRVNTQNNNNHPMIKNNRAASDGYFGLKDMTSLKQQVMGIFSSGKVKNGDTRDNEKDNGDGNKDGDKIIAVEDNRNEDNGEADLKKNKKKSKKKKAKKDQ